MQSTMAARVVAFGMAALAVAMRLAAGLAMGFPAVLQGVFNFNPVGALGLFGGSRLKSWQAYVLPLALMVGTDVCLGLVKGHEYSLLHPSRIWVYQSFMVYAVIGRFVIGDSKNPFVIAAATLLGAAQFFLVTNFCEWLFLSDLYTRDLTGLMTSYLAAIPFSLNSLAGDLIFTPLAFIAHGLLTRAAPVGDEQLTANALSTTD